MTDPRLLLDLYGEEAAADPVDLWGVQGLPQFPMQPQVEQPVQQVGSGNIVNRIQEMLGAKEPDSGGSIADILSGRFSDRGMGTSYGDYAQGIVQSALGKPLLGPEVTSSRTSDMLKKLAEIQALDTASARADLYRKGGTGTNGATMQIIQGLMAANPGMTFDQALYQYQTGNRQGTNLTPGGIAIIPGTLAANEAISNSKKIGQERADITVDKEKRLPGATASLTSSVGGSKNVFDSIQRAKQQSGAFTTGFIGSMVNNIPGTPAYDLARTIDTVKANIGFDKLGQMRAMSPTGGALGQVSDFENRLLQSTIANLEQSQTREQFEDNLDRVNQQYIQSMSRLRQAYINDFGETDGFDALFSQVPELRVPAKGVGNIGGEQSLQPGDVQDGYEYIGGDPANSQSWKKVQ